MVTPNAFTGKPGVWKFCYSQNVRIGRVTSELSV